ncbi:MAG: hypothetical protein ACLF0P_04330 [Thermoanaerobaculia bacterium]
MSDERKGEPPSPEGHDWSYEEHRRRQTRRGLEMTPAERLRWLEQTMAELRELEGRARRR